MSKEEIKLSQEVIDEVFSEAIKLDGFDDCVVGVVSTFNTSMLLLYDIEKIIRKLMERDKMTWEEAVEYYAYNIRGAYFGYNSPIFLEWEVKKGELVPGDL